MRNRAILAAFSGGVLASAAAFLACSGGNSGTADASISLPDASRDVGVTVFETSTGDGHVTVPDGQTLDGGVPDGDAGSDATDAPFVIDTGSQGMCSLVTGACDIVAQDCPAGNECAVVQGDGGLVTGCIPIQATEHLGAGQPCCPPASGANPCQPGLECNGGNNCVVDAGSPGPGLPPGWGGSRCAPRCCPSDGGANTANCGTDGDGGTQGHCDLQITFTNGGPAEYSICTYPEVCEPFHIRPCIDGFGCDVTDQNGTATCSVIFNPTGDGGAGATEGQTCQYLNQCADGLACLGPATGTSTCQWMCLIPGQNAPFDAGANSAPGYGGCPSGKTCTAVTGFPAWLGSCN